MHLKVPKMRFMLNINNLKHNSKTEATLKCILNNPTIKVKTRNVAPKVFSAKAISNFISIV